MYFYFDFLQAYSKDKFILNNVLPCKTEILFFSLGDGCPIVMKSEGKGLSLAGYNL